jgi:3-oxoacyl-[acyl-carrier protein] reductase
VETGLHGKVVLVTGGAGGIGQAICRAFAAEGARVVVHHHSSSDAAESLAEEVGGMAIRADLRDDGEALSMVRSIVSEWGALDVCIANAGHYPNTSKPFWEIDAGHWASTLDSNLGVTANTSRAFLCHAAEVGRGSMVLIGSTAGIYGESGHAGYATAKGAITSGLLMTLKNDVSQIGSVRVNAVAPGWTVTPRKIEQGVDDGLLESATATMALKKLATPGDVASAVVMLASDEISGHITGQVIEVAGGMEGRLIP